MLELPELGRLPRNWTMHRPGALSARTALALLDAGHLPPSTPKASPASLIHTGLQRWIDTQTEGMTLLSFSIDYAETDLPDAPGSTIQIAARKGSEIFIGAKLGELERRFTGLGRAVLHEIDRTALLGVPFFTPASALRWARQLYWTGRNREGRMTLSAFHHAMPRWTAEPHNTDPLDSAQLRGMAVNRTKLKPRLAGDVAAAILELREARDTCAPLIRRGDARAIPDPQYSCQALMLRWSRNDAMARVEDDRRHHAWAQRRNDSLASYFAIKALPEQRAGKPYEDRVRDFLAGVEPMFKVLRATDRLVNKISGGNT